jgi:WD40 repeat protein
LCLSPDGETVAVARADRVGAARADRAGDAPALRLHSVRDGRVRHTLGSNDVRGMCFSPDGRSLLATSFDGPPRVWDVRTGTLRHQLPNADLNEPVFAPDGRAVYAFTEAEPEGGTAFDAGDVRVHVIKFPGASLTYSLRFATVSPDGRALVAGVYGSLYFWDLTAGAPGEWFALHTASDVFQSFAWAPDRRWLATADQKGTVRLWSWPGIFETARSAP